MRVAGTDMLMADTGTGITVVMKADTMVVIMVATQVAVTAHVRVLAIA